MLAVRGRGTPVPFDCPPRLVIAGPYAYIRNPMAVSALAGQNIGAGNVERAARIGRLGTLMGFWILTAMGVIAFVFAPSIVAFFVPRDAAVIRAAAEKAGWQPRTSPRAARSGEVLSGRGIAYAVRNGTVVAAVAEIEVERKSGRIWGRKFTVAHDCGLIINPEGIRYTIEGNVVQGLSRTLFEEVRFDREKVTSVDWLSYPILEIRDAPETIEVVLINHPEIAPSGAGEPTIRVIPAAVANAFFDATGVRLRRAPLTPERVKAALARA